MNKNGFINIIIIGVIAIIIAAAGYFAMTRKTAEAPAAIQETETINGATNFKVLPHLITDVPAGADVGTVILSSKSLGLLKKVFPAARAAHTETHRILVYLNKDLIRDNQNQIFYYDLDTKEQGQFTNELGHIDSNIHVIDFPVSAVLYYTSNSFNLLRLSDLSTIKLSGKNPGANNSYAVSPDYTHLAYFDEESNLVVRDLSRPNIDIVQVYPNPVSGSTKGNKDISPLVYSSDGDKLYLYKTTSHLAGDRHVGASDIISFNLNDETTETILSDNTLKRPPSIPLGDDNLYYVDYSIFPMQASVNKLNLFTKNKISMPPLPRFGPGWEGLYLKDKILVYSSYTDGVKNKIGFLIGKYDFTTNQSSILFNVEMDIDSQNTGRGGLIGLGTDENEFILKTFRDEKENEITQNFYLYNTDTQQLTLLFSAPVIFTGPRG